MKQRSKRLLSMLCVLTLLLGLVPLGAQAAATPQTWTWADQGAFFTANGARKGREMSYNGTQYTEGLKLYEGANITFTVPSGEAGVLTMVFANTSTDKNKSNFQLDGQAIPMEPQKTTMQVYTNDKLAPGSHTIAAGQKEATVYYLEWAVAHTHVWDTGTVTKEPTCTETGEKTFHCSAGDCPNPTKTEPVAPKGHTPKQIAEIPATCVVDGKTAELVCAVCNEHLSGGVVIPATGAHTDADGDGVCDVCQKVLPAAHEHVFDGREVQLIQAATCTAAGSHRVECSVENCDATEIQTIAPLGHDLQHHAQVDPVCGAGGHAAYDTCRRCDYTTYKATSHTAGADGVCAVCGEVVSQPLTNAGGWFETLYAVLPGFRDADVTAVSYSGAMKGSLRGDDLRYLVRDTDEGVRVDIPGLTAGTYTLSVTAKGTTYEATGIQVMEYDRSGYAHWNYTDGVGAYRDDGVLKDDAIVLYVTEETKNTVTLEAPDGTTVTGIGNILNTNGQDTGGGSNSKGGLPNSNQGILKKLADANIPLVVRIVGDVKSSHPNPTIDGLSAYDSVDYGGSVGDNGNMARMKACKDITIEGIGPDACVNGWGFHFICGSDDPAAGRGKSFEVRNVAFRNVPEDCIGMEGQQEGSTLTAPVERGWVHNCAFYAPSINPAAESDKKGGDGACDFKRGQYFTMDYCYYEGYHKTNLVGSSDSSLQYHITWHHNHWKSCESRGPLGRQANMHIYNCIYEDQTSYAMNPRADCYIFSEYNTFKNAKNPMQIKKGAIKSYKDVFSGTSGAEDGTIVTDKAQEVTSANKYKSFELDSSLSYIPSGDYKLDNSVTKARQNITAYAGPMKAQIIKAEDVSTEVVEKERVPAAAVVLPYDQALNKAYIASAGEKDNIRFDLSGSDASFLKFGKTTTGQDIIFKVDEPVDISIEDGGGTGKAALFNASGEDLIIGTGTATNLPAGVYFIQSSMIQPGKDGAPAIFKEAKIAHLTITKTASTTPPHVHNYTNWTQTVAPTCTKVGTEIGTCSCGETDRRDVPKLAHNYVNGVCEMCGVLEGTFSGGNEGPDIPVTGLSVSPSEVSVLQGQTQQIDYTVEPSDATDKTVEWASDNTAVATVTRRGVITGVGPGACTVIATAGGITKNISVTVIGMATETFTFSANAEGPDPVPSNPGPALEDGSTWGTQGYFTNVGADKNTWTAKNFTGKVPDKTPGSVLLASQQGGAFSFTVGAGVEHADVELNVSSTGSANRSAVAILKGNSLADATFVPDAEGDRLTVCQGTATTNVKYTLAPGTYFIVAPAGVLAGEVDDTWDDFVTDANNPNKRGVRLHRVVVTENSVSSGEWIPAQSVTLNETALTVEAGMRATLLATVLPENTTNKTVTWRSSDASVASVDKGTVYGRKEGTATITATCGGQMAACTVTVTPSTHVPVFVESITIDGPTSVTLDGVRDQEVQLTRLVLPEEADDREVIWSSDTPGVTVNSRGLVTIAAETPSGAVTITAEARDGSGVTATHTITVTAPARVEINNVTILKNGVETTEETLAAGQSLTVTALVEAEGLSGATVTDADRAVEWYSSNADVATVEGGVITALTPGVCIITAESVRDDLVYEDLILTVTEAVPGETVAVTGVSLDRTAASLRVNGTTTLTATVAPANATNKGVYWVSSDTSVATVDQSGKVTGVKAGSATVTVTTDDGGKSASCTLTVTAGSTGGGGGGGSSTTTPNMPITPDVPSSGASMPFIDVAPTAWFHNTVKRAFELGLMRGTDDVHFAPNATTTRAMVATVLYRLDGEKSGDVNALFTDVASGQWYTQAIAWAAGKGVVKGYDATTFAPDDNVTREQLAVMLYRYAAPTGQAEKDLSAFADAASVSSWAKDAMTWAVDKGIITGKGSNVLDPQGMATRAEICTMLVRYLDLDK